MIGDRSDYALRPSSGSISGDGCIKIARPIFPRTEAGCRMLSDLGSPHGGFRMNRETWSPGSWKRTAAALAALLVIPIAAAKDKEKKEAPASPVIAKVNGEDVTKAEFDEVMKANQRFYDLASETVRNKLKGKPLTDYLFREEIVKIRAYAQKNAEALPAMKAALEQVESKLSGGTDFADVAKELSQEKASAERGGSLGTEPQGFFDFVHPFNHVALSL